MKRNQASLKKDKLEFFLFKSKFEAAGWQPTPLDTPSEESAFRYQLVKRTFWLNKDTVKSGAAVRALAYGLGYLAFKLGLQRLPGSDARLAEWCDGSPAGGSIMAFNWCGGWDAAKSEK